MMQSEDNEPSRRQPRRIPRGIDVVATAPARIDLAGGWTDTPPICFEHGGRVVNMAVSVNGQHPFMVRGRRTERLSIVLSHGDSCEQHEFRTLEEIEDHQDPMAPCSLLKACIIASGILDDDNDEAQEQVEEGGVGENGMLRSDRSTCPNHSQQEAFRPIAMTHDLHAYEQEVSTLSTTTTTTLHLPSPPESILDDETQERVQPSTAIVAPKPCEKQQSTSLTELLRRTGGGIEMEMTSSLPVGSGMGTSSILAAAALAVLSTLQCGQSLPTNILLERTLQVEQMMRTGGGWQDQVGGVLPGLKVGVSQRNKTLQLSTRPLDVTDATMEELDRRLLLIYTGQTRLAKNLLQTVLDQWASRELSVVETMRSLVEDASLCESMLENGDLAGLGEIMTRYFAHKRFLSSTGLDHPPVVAVLTDLLAPFMDGSVLAGAGGGGFLAVLLKQGLDRDVIVQRIREQLHQVYPSIRNLTEEEERGMWSWHAQIDRQGLCVRVVEE